jgi:hypothetical protein
MLFTSVFIDHTTQKLNKLLRSLAAICLSGCASMHRNEHAPTIASASAYSFQPPLYGALYTEPHGSVLISQNFISTDDGATWSELKRQLNFQTNLPPGFRRTPVTSVLDPNTSRVLTIFNALDTPGLDPKIFEPKIAQQNYYLRYRVSTNGGRTWLFDEPIIEQGSFDATHPFNDVFIGTNAIYMGDAGSIPVVTKSDKILVPTQTTIRTTNGTLFNPAGGYTYTDVLVLIGTWTTNNRLQWNISKRVNGDPTRTTRGLLEPTLAQLPDGRILMIMRGSNGGKSDPQHELPSYKWTAVSSDDGTTWSKAEPLLYDDGAPAYSPSSMSTLLTHSSGRCFWAGNLTSTNCQGNLPRYPLVIGEIDPKTARLIRSSIVTVDTRHREDDAQGRLDISHLTMFEDRHTHEIVLTYPRAHNAYKSREWRTVKLLPSK